MFYFALLLACTFMIPVNAAPIIGNLPGNDGAAVIDLDLFKTKAMGFTMGSQMYSLDGVSLRLRMIDFTATPVVQIWSNDSSDNPGTLLVTLGNPSLPANGAGTYVFTPSTPFVLNAGITYWLVVGTTAASTDPSELDWLASNPDTAPTGPGATHFGARYDGDGPPPAGASSLRNLYQLDGSPVPEPATLALMGAGLAVAMIRRIGFRG